MSVAVQPIKAPCRQLRAKHDSGPRKASEIKLIVIHATEGGSAESVAEFFHTTAQASTHLVVDDKECYRMLPDLVVPWGAPGANQSGLHIEHCAWTKWSREQWLEHDAMLRRSAYKAARWCHLYGVKPRWVGSARRWLGLTGFVTHNAVTRHFGTVGGHTDPGPGFPYSRYITYVQAYLRSLAPPNT